MVMLSRWVHSGIFGTTGTGKSTLAELICEMEYINNKAKIIDLQNNKALEAYSFMIPTKNKYFLNNLKKYKDDILKPRGFPTKIYHPIVSTLPPKLPGPIKLFSLPVDFFAYEEVLRVLTNDSMGDAAYVSLTQEIEKLKDDDALPTIPTKILESINKKILKTSGLGVDMYFPFDTSTSATSANRPLLKVKNVGVFSSRKYEHVLSDKNLEIMLKNHREITAFSTRWIEQRHKKLKIAINLYLLMKIRDVARKVKGDVIVYIREARELFPHTRQSDKSMKVLGELAEDMVKDCRKSGIRLLLDTQTPWDLPDGVLNQLSTRFIFRHDSREADIVDMYRGSASLRPDLIKSIKQLSNYRFYISDDKVSSIMNPRKGHIMDYKLSGHLEENQNEILSIKRAFPEQGLYSTRNYVESLKDDWYHSQTKHGKRIDRRYRSDEEVSMAKTIGFSTGQFRVLKYLYSLVGKSNGGDVLVVKDERPIKLRDIQNGALLARSTAHDSLDKLQNQGFIKRTKKSHVILTAEGKDMVRSNANVFKIAKETKEDVEETEP